MRGSARQGGAVAGDTQSKTRHGAVPHVNDDEGAVGTQALETIKAWQFRVVAG